MQTEVKVSEAAPDAAADDWVAAPRARNKSWVIRLVSIVVVLVAWEIGGRRINPLFMSYPSAIVGAGIAMFESGELMVPLASSLRTLLVGFVTASVIGIVVGL